MTSEEAARERDRVRQEASERSSAERNKSTQQRVQEIKNRNIERTQQRESATNILTSGTANIGLTEIANRGGSLGRRLEREIRQFQQTGRVSNWLAGETLKAESAQNAAQQSAFRQAVVDVISNPLTPIQVGPTNSYIPKLSLKPIIQDGGGGGTIPSHPFKISSTQNPENINEYFVTINAGTLNSILPSNLFSEDDLTKFVIPSNELRYVKLLGFTNGTNQFTTCSIQISKTPALPQTPTAFSLPSTVEFLIGAVRNLSTYNSINNSISVTGKIQITTERGQLPLAGELPYINYYVWS